MKIQKDKSILSQKCKCGEPIDYFKLHEHMLKETKSTRDYIPRFTIFIIVWSILACIIAYYIGFPITDNLLAKGIFYGGVSGFMISYCIMLYYGYKTKKDYHHSEARKYYIRWKNRVAYRKSLPKNINKRVRNAKDRVFQYTWLSMFLILLPLLILVLLFGEDNAIQNELSIIGITTFIGWGIYLLKINKIYNFIENKMKKKLKDKYNVDYDLYFKGVKP